MNENGDSDEETGWRGAGMGQRDRSIGSLFQHVARLRNRYFDRLLAPHDLSSGQVRVINLLLRKQGRSQVELARILGVGTVAVSSQLDRLEKNGWVVRKPDEHDRRTNRVWLTQKGIEVEQFLVQEFGLLNDASFEGMSADEVETLATMLRRVRQNLEQACDD